MLDHQNLIQGKWVESGAGERMESHNPANPKEILWTFPAATLEDAHAAVEAARTAFPGWARVLPSERGAILERASRILEDRAREIATILTQEEGKTLPESLGEVNRARDIFRYFAGEGWRNAGSVYPGSASGELLYSQREPLGVVTLITPWNFPIAIPAWKIAPALVYGNTVVFKPAHHGEGTALALVNALVEAGLPPGVLNFITGAGSTLSAELTATSAVNGISFTGSVAVGTRIYQQAVPHLIRVQLEMGGKNPLVILEDANLDLAVSLTVRGGFGLTGQACTATSRVIVEEGIADEFARRICEAAEKLKIGNGLEKGVQMGPAVSQDQMETDLKYVQIGQDEGARLAVGGGPAGDGGFFVQPTVFDHVRESMRIAKEEIFGPVVSLIRARNFEDALEKANAAGFGLAAGVVTRDLKKAFTFANRIEAGVVKINEPTTGLALQAPFGGFKQSSANTFKEQGPAAIEFYTRTKTIYVGHGG
ncbi:MAG TPA: aldehyde dehydrogenase family protein [Anaerolineaceae bacterium]|nr:aldehyde dehydrogenase family protein [Anaerolineaceae bacterium]